MTNFEAHEEKIKSILAQKSPIANDVGGRR